MYSLRAGYPKRTALDLPGARSGRGAVRRRASECRLTQVQEDRNVPTDQALQRATVLDGLDETSQRDALVRRYNQVRQFTERLCQPLMTEDYVIQAMPDVSPPKWHLAHTSWFFETFILAAASPNYCSPHASYAYLFNSYYVAA